MRMHAGFCYILGAMVLWMTHDAFAAALLGLVIILTFVGYNSSRNFKKEAERKSVAGKSDAKIESKPDNPARWN